MTFFIQFKFLWWIVLLNLQLLCPPTKKFVCVNISFPMKSVITPNADELSQILLIGIFYTWLLKILTSCYLFFCFSFTFIDFDLSDEDTCRATIRMFLQCNLVEQFHIPYEVNTFFSFIDLATNKFYLDIHCWFSRQTSNRFTCKLLFSLIYNYVVTKFIKHFFTEKHKILN